METINHRTTSLLVIKMYGGSVKSAAMNIRLSMKYKLLSTAIKKISLINELQAEGQFDLSGGQQSQSSSYLKIELNTVGIFELEEEVSDLDQIKNDLHAAMFPYVRAYITTITSLSGLPPITLPDMSIVDM